jgi:hypothetical protein
MEVLTSRKSTGYDGEELLKTRNRSFEKWKTYVIVGILGFNSSRYFGSKIGTV